MKRLRILVVGGLAAGPAAAAKAARTNPNAQVTLFEQSETISYGLCEGPYAISGEIPEEQRLVVYTPERLQAEKGVEARILHRVEGIAPTRHRLVVRNLGTGDLGEHEYDRLVVTTGSLPRRLNVEGEDGRNVYHVRSRDDILGIVRTLEGEKPAEAVIIGGGYIGMEMAESLRRRGLGVTLLHRHRLPMSGLEEETRERVAQELSENAVRFVTNVRVGSLLQDATGRVVQVATNKGSFETQLVILSLGVVPNVELARSARIRLGPTGAIATDQRQLTNLDDVYAAGDCCQVRNTVNNKPMYIPLATVAARQAWVAGENAAGGRGTFTGAIRAIAVRVFGLEVAQVGISSEEARESGFDPLVQSVTAWEKIALMPGSAKIRVKLVVDRRSGRLLGANVFGAGGAVLRANTLGVAIHQKMTLDDIARLDLIYSPPYAPLWDPILIAANEARKKL